MASTNVQKLHNARSKAKNSSSDRISVSLTGAAADTVRELADQLGLPEGVIVRRAIGLFKEIEHDRANGAQLVIRHADGAMETIRFLATS